MNDIEAPKEKKPIVRVINKDLFLELTKANITRAGYKVVLMIINFTLGYKKTESEISYKTFIKYTELSKTSVKAAIKELQGKNIIKIPQKHTNRSASIYKLNTDFTTWIGVQARLYPRGKARLHSKQKKDSKNLPLKDIKTYTPDVENLPSRVQVVTNETTMPKENIYIKPFKENPLKKTGDNGLSLENITDGKPDTNPKGNPKSENPEKDSFSYQSEEFITTAIWKCIRCHHRASSSNPIQIKNHLCRRCLNEDADIEESQSPKIEPIKTGDYSKHYEPPPESMFDDLDSDDINIKNHACGELTYFLEQNIQYFPKGFYVPDIRQDLLENKANRSIYHEWWKKAIEVDLPF